MPTKFLRPIIIDQQTLGVSYRATGISQMRYFEMNITKLEIPEGISYFFDHVSK